MSVSPAVPVILTIEDEASVRFSISNFLEDYDYKVLEAENGKDGLDIIRCQPVDLVLVDLRMPEMDGLEVLSAVREINENLPVIVISGTGNISDVVEAMRLGAWDYLLKPITDMTMLSHAIEKGLERARLINDERAYQANLERQVSEKTNELETVNERLKAVVETTKRLLGYGELLDSGSTLLQEFGTHMNAVSGSIYQVIPEGLQKVGELGTYHNYDFLPFPLKENSVFSHAMKMMEPFFIDDIAKHPEFLPSGFQSYHNGTCIIFPIKKKNGELRAIVSLHDKVQPPFTTQDKEIGSILMSYSAEALETAHAVKALKKSEDFLMQAQKIQAIGTMAGGIAHDFNNILSAIVGYTDLSLYSGECTEKIYHNLELVKKASDRAKELVSQILAFSRTESYQEKPLDLAPVIKEALKLLRSTIPSTVSMEKDIVVGKGKVVADPTRIHQIIMNLCNNSLHAMGNQCGWIKITYDRVPVEECTSLLETFSGTHCMRLRVSDNGHGMSPDVVRKVFDPYFTTKKKGMGTGLGLAVVQSIVQASGGTIKVESRPGTGTTFSIYFPCVENEDDAIQEGCVLEVQSGTEHILVVDDEHDLVDMTRLMLERLGYTVTVMTSSVEAFDALEKEPDRYDLLITDQTMPVLSGTELAKRAIMLRSDLPIILYTGYSAAVDESEARKIGIREFMLKPLNINRLSRIVRQVLDQKTLT